MLAKRFGFDPETVANMTLDQLVMYLEGEDEGGGSPRTVRFASLEEALAFKESKRRGG